MSEETKTRRVLPDNPALLALNKCAKATHDLTDVQKAWVLRSLAALLTGELPDSAAKG